MSNLDVRRWVDQYVTETDGAWFFTEYIWRRFNIITKDGKEAVYQRLKEHTTAKRIEKDGLRYRKKDTELNDVDIFQKEKFVFIKYPLDLQNYFRLTEGALMVIAGGKDSWKTGFQLNLAYLNMYDWEVHYFDSESGGTLLGERLYGIDPNLPNPLPFKIHHRVRNFSDVIFPDALNIIDYLDLGKEFQNVGEELLRIVEALNKGVAIVGLQKPPPSRTKDGKLIIRDWGYGGISTIHRAQVALSLDKGKLKIVAAKSRANKRVDPVNKTWTFSLDETGSKVIKVNESMWT